MVGMFIAAAKPVIYGLAIAYLLNPIVKNVDKRLMPFLDKRFPNFKKKEQFVKVCGDLCFNCVFAGRGSGAFEYDDSGTVPEHPGYDPERAKPDESFRVRVQRDEYP